MTNTISANLCMKLIAIVLLVVNQVVALHYLHYINLSETKLPTTRCQKLNDTTYNCGSINELFQQLSDCCNSTDITIEPGTYDLAMSHVLEDLHDIRIRSETNAVIQCAANVNGSYDFDTGIAFVRVRNLVINNISIIGCGMKHVTPTYIIEDKKFIFVRSALYIQNSTNVILNSVNISENNGIGLLIYDTNGSVSINNSTFVNNNLNISEQSKYFTGGGGVYIEFTECTPGVNSCNSTGNYFNILTSYAIRQCRFEDNTAIYRLNGSGPIDHPRGVFIPFGIGGGLAIWLYGHAQSNYFQITSTLFTSNKARYGGGLNVHSWQNTRHNFVEISECYFLGNTGDMGGGGLALGYVIYQDGRQSLYNKYIIINCIFKQNKALTGVGGGVMGFGSWERQQLKPTNQFEIHNSSFIGNGAQYGSAIEINKEYYASITGGTMFTLILDNCTFTDNNLNENNSSTIGAVAMSGVNVEFRGTTVFSNNNSTALIVDGACVKFFDNSLTVFQDNSGLHGGAISLVSGAWISIYENSTLNFLRNRAIKYGGAIYVSLSTPFDYLLSHICFVRYYSERVPPHEWNTNLTFINNSAGESNSTIFASTLRPCLRVYPRGIIENLYKDPQSSALTNSFISTLPDTFKFLNSNMFAIVPGEIFDLPVQLIDELNQSVSDITFIATCIGPPSSPYVLPAYHFTNGSIQIAGRPREICQLQLKTDTDYQFSVTVQVPLLKCPPGFVYNSNIKQCRCLVNHTHHNSAISGCELASFQAYFNHFYWIGYESDDAVDLLISPCPYRYCYEDHIFQGQLLPRDANKTTLDKFVCGNRMRTGFLCGKCVEGYSVSMNSPTFTCYRCTNPYLGILYLILSYIIPVTALFYIIMFYNIRMTTGPIGAFLFFSQIISSQYHFAFDYSVKSSSDKTRYFSDIVVSIYSITNLQFFHHDVFSYCLFPNAGTVDILAFDLLLSFYPVLLVFAYFVLRRYFTCNVQCIQRFRLSNKSITHGVCAFLVLCFAKINVLAFGILKSASISYVNGMNFKVVVYFQGSLKYFRDPLYDVYAISSLFAIITVIFIPTLILLFHPIMMLGVRYFKLGDTKCVTFINKLLFIHKLKPVLDSFQGDYKDNFSFFAGLHSFLYRIIFFTIIVAASTPDMDGLLLLIIAFYMIILLVHMLTMPFRSYIDNASYSLIYVLILAIVIIEYYLLTAAEKSSSGLVRLEIILSLLPFMCLVLYCLWKMVIAAGLLWRKYHKVNNESDLDGYQIMDFPQRAINDCD